MVIRVSLLFCLFFGFTPHLVEAQELDLDSFRMIRERVNGYLPSTVFQIIGENEDTYQLAVYKYHSSDQTRRLTLGRIEISKSVFDQTPQTVGAKLVSIDNNGELSLEHPENGRIERIPEFVPHEEVVCEVPATRGTAHTTPAEHVLSEAEKSDQEQEELAAKIAERDRIYNQMIQDYDWFEKERTKIIERLSKSNPNFLSELKGKWHDSKSKRVYPKSAVQQTLLRELLTTMVDEARFKQEPVRAERILTALTLYGEFGTVPAYRTLPNLYWAHQSIKNRAQQAAWKNVEVPTVLDPKNKIQSAFGKSRLSVVLATSQYSTWNAGDFQLSNIMMNEMGPTTRDIFDFLAADEAGLIATQQSAPAITHYVSPVGLVPYSQKASINSQEQRARQRLSAKALAEFLPFKNKDYPAWFFSPQVTIYDSSELPEINRLDQTDKTGLIRTPKGTHEKRINSRYFASGRENR